MKLSDIGEFGLIERIRRSVAPGDGVHRGIGDDAAELQLPDGHHLLTSTDLLIEGIHFRRDWTTSEALGHKAVAVNLSDIAAMAGTPRFLYLGLACPGDTDLQEIDAFLAGALDEAKAFGVTLVGGDTCRSPGPWMISVTVEGSVPSGKAIGRNGARAGDVVMVSGTLGDSALALRILTDGGHPDPYLSSRHHRPTPRVDLGQELGKKGLPTAMIDLSDGLTSDLEHILQSSHVDGMIDLAELPLSTAFLHQAERDTLVRELALHGGEDYELLFTVPPERVAEATALGVAMGIPVRPIGAISAGQGRLAVREADGTLQTIRVRGFDHFCQSSGEKGLA